MDFKYNVNNSMKGITLIFIIAFLLGIAIATTSEQNKTAEPQEVKPIVINDKQTHTEDKSPKETSVDKPDKPHQPVEVPPVEQIKQKVKESAFTFNDSNTFESIPIATPASVPDPQLAFETQRQVQLQEQKHQEEVKEQQRGLRPWIAQQMQSMQQQTEGIVTESFQFILDPEVPYIFRWDPPKTQMLSISVLVFQIMDNGEIVLEHDLEEGEKVDVALREEGHNSFNSLGHVYFSKVFRINFDTDYKYFQFTSHVSRSILVVVDLEKTQEVINKDKVAQDHHFLLPLEKLKAIEEQVQSGEKIREHTYKYEWGFLDNQFAHDSRLLGLTGFELVVIIGAAIVQLYFIKSLLDNRAVV